MRRKIVKHGKSTLTVSLPNKWAREQGISSGDDIEVAEKGDFLIIGSMHTAKANLDIDLTRAGNELARMITAIYKAGFDRASIMDKNPDDFYVIQDTIYRNCHVFEPVEIGKDTVQIRSISKLRPDDVSRMLSNSTNACLEMANQALEGLKRRDYALLRKIELKDKILDRYTVYGNRVINKGFDVGFLPGPLYLLFDQIETAGDAIKNLCKYVADKQAEPSEQMLALFSEIPPYAKAMFGLLHNFSMLRVEHIGDQDRKIREIIDNFPAPDDARIFSLILITFEVISELKSAIYTVNMDAKAKDL